MFFLKSNEVLRHDMTGFHTGICPMASELCHLLIESGSYEAFSHGWLGGSCAPIAIIRFEVGTFHFLCPDHRAI